VHRSSIAALAVVVALAGAACSDDDGGGDDTSAAPLTKAELIEQGDLICKAFDDRVDEVTASLSEDSTREDVVDLIRDRLVPLQEGLVEELAELEPPPEDEATYDRALDNVRLGIRAIRADPEGFVDGELASTALDRADDGLQQYGFTVCGARRDASS
jgi:hypothetical protein